MGVLRPVFLASLGFVACKKEPSVSLAATKEADAEVAAPNLVAPPHAPKVAALSLETRIYERPDAKSKMLGYFRVGQTLSRSESPEAASFYQVSPRGYVSVGEPATLTKDQGMATLDLDHKIIHAVGVKPDLSKPMPYLYGFVRRDATLWHMVPDHNLMDKWEYAFQGHLKEYAKNHVKWNKIDKAGANHVPLDEQGNAKMLPKEVPPPPPAVDPSHVFPDYGDGKIPTWLAWEELRGRLVPRRKIPNLSSFQAPDEAVPRGKVYRHAGLAVLGSFVSEEKSDRRKFTVLLDGRLIGEDKIRPHYASAFHGLSLEDGAHPFPFAMVRRREAFKYGDAGTRRKGKLTFREVIPLTGKSALRQAKFYFETKEGYWVREDEAAVFTGQAEPPKVFDWKKTKWVDVSITFQSLVMYEGEKPVYATLVSTGVDETGDPYTTKSTVRGEFRIDTKHVTATMDADDPENRFELRDVPWVQYFEGGFALHAAYWHDDFGRPRSHGCVNLSPVDARRLFFWTDPPLPEGWHGVTAGKSMGEGTWVRVRR